MDKSVYGHLGALLVTMVWGSTFVSSKVLLMHGLQPAEIFVVRFIMAYLFMLCVSHKRMMADSIKDELTLLGLGIMGGSLYFLTENMALLYSTSANVSILVSTSPLITMILCSMFYKDERMNHRQVFGSLVAFVGMVLVVINGQLVLHLNPLGDALAFCAALTWGFYSLFMRRIMSRYSSDFITRKIFFYGVVTILPYFLLVEGFHSDLLLNASLTITLNLLFLGVVASTGGYLLWNWCMKQLGAVRSTNYIYLQPLVTLLFGCLILNETITLMGMAGAFVLILGMIRVNRK